MRRALFGGSFDPPHNGHLAIIRAVHERDLADEVLVVPAGRNPHKDAASAPAEHRLRMAELAFADLPAVRVLDVEARRAGASYTVETLAELRRLHPGDDWLLLIGLDNLLEFERWRDPERILELAELIVFPRRELPTLLPSRFAERAHVISGFDVDVSSTLVRASLSAGRRPSAWLPAGVLAYIEAHHLYVPSSPALGREERDGGDLPCR